MDTITENPNNATVTTATVVKRGVGRPKTKITLKRVVLLDGNIVGRGRPSKETKGERTVVFIPIDETYTAAKHGVGKKYMAGLAQYRLTIKRMDISAFKKLTQVTA